MKKEEGRRKKEEGKNNSVPLQIKLVLYQFDKYLLQIVRLFLRSQE
ncbi:MAG: hypothetical protein F6K17_27470, partial [Okeania sp. SIO3C4]|nr:hypothetical protein [Okeania sp. SIO3C4]